MNLIIGDGVGVVATKDRMTTHFTKAHEYNMSAFKAMIGILGIATRHSIEDKISKYLNLVIHSFWFD